MPYIVCVSFGHVHIYIIIFIIIIIIYTRWFTFRACQTWAVNGQYSMAWDY